MASWRIAGQIIINIIQNSVIKINNMEKKIIKLSIDVSKIDKTKLYNGQKGIYLNAVLMFKDEPDKYGNIGFIVQDSTKEEREAGKRGEILGNAKYLAKGQPSETNNNSASNDNDLPF